MSSYLARVNAWCFDYSGSTRSSAIIRIGLVFLIWARWAGELSFFQHLSLNYFLLSVSFFLSTTLMLVGYKTRISTLWVSATLFLMYFHFSYGLGVSGWNHHHTYLLAWMSFLSALTPAGKSYSVDRKLLVRESALSQSPMPPEYGNLWGLRLIMLQLCVLYFWAAFDKSYPLWVSGVRMEYYAVLFYFGSTFVEPWWFNPLMRGLALVVLVLEYVLAFGLFFKRFQSLLIPFGIAMHAAFFLLLPVHTYSLTCILMYLAVIEARKVHEFTE
ncbi:MAG: HTTM domain-containing protein [Porticoccaceae bacterium]|nr:HTTM domain-containing protein [Porticoccaceae bacterium]